MAADGSDDGRAAEIEAARAAAMAAGEEALRPDKDGTYGIVCRMCAKPNAPEQRFCTGCGFACSKWDLQRLPDNVFLDLVRGKDIGAVVRFRSDEYVVFDDKYGVSEHHLDVIPARVVADIAGLTADDVPMVEELYRLARAELQRRVGPEAAADSRIMAGFNYPVSVKHLHLHAVLAPFKHEKVFQYPRWHPLKKVLADLREHGRVRTFEEAPDPEAGAAEYARAMALHRGGE